MLKNELISMCNRGCREYVSEQIGYLYDSFENIKIDEAIQILQDYKREYQDKYKLLYIETGLEDIFGDLYAKMDVFGIRKRTEDELKIYDEKKKKKEAKKQNKEYETYLNLKKKYDK